MGEYIHKPGGAIKTSDALLDYLLSKRDEHLMDAWKLTYTALICDEMLTSSESDRTAMVHEMLFVIRGDA